MRAKTVINDLIFKVMQKFELKDICFFDCETTGVPAKGLKWDADFEQFPHVVQLAWSLGDKEKSYIIKPDNYEIPPETTAIHGITTERQLPRACRLPRLWTNF